MVLCKTGDTAPLKFFNYFSSALKFVKNERARKKTSNVVFDVKNDVHIACEDRI